jgi:hypothetical protein
MQAAQACRQRAVVVVLPRPPVARRERPWPPVCRRREKVARQPGPVAQVGRLQEPEARLQEPEARLRVAQVGRLQEPEARRAQPACRRPGQEVPTLPARVARRRELVGRQVPQRAGLVARPQVLVVVAALEARPGGPPQALALVLVPLLAEQEERPQVPVDRRPRRRRARQRPLRRRGPIPRHASGTSCVRPRTLAPALPPEVELLQQARPSAHSIRGNDHKTRRSPRLRLHSDSRSAYKRSSRWTSALTR